MLNVTTTESYFVIESAELTGRGPMEPFEARMTLAAMVPPAPNVYELAREEAVAVLKISRYEELCKAEEELKTLKGIING